MKKNLLPVAILGLINACRGVDAAPKWVWFLGATFIAYWVCPEPVFAASWGAFALAMWVPSWGNGISILNDRVEWTYDDSDRWIVRLVDGLPLTLAKLMYWHVRASYGLVVILVMAIYYKEPMLLFVGLLPQTIGYVGWLLGKLSQWNNNWRLVEVYMGCLLGEMIILTGGLVCKHVT